MALAGVELLTLVSEPDVLTTRLPPCKETDNLIKKSKFVPMYAQKSDAVANSSLLFVLKAPINLSKKRKLLTELRVDFQLVKKYIAYIVLINLVVHRLHKHNKR